MSLKFPKATGHQATGHHADIRLADIGTVSSYQFRGGRSEIVP
jgi:hypothetical protein